MSTMKEIYDQVIMLSVSERASLAHDLILSLDEASDFELNSDQEAEIQRRLKMEQEGTEKGRPAEEIFTDIKARYS